MLLQYSYEQLQCSICDSRKDIVASSAASCPVLNISNNSSNQRRLLEVKRVSQGFLETRKQRKNIVGNN